MQKHYPTLFNEAELLSGILQIRIDQIKESHPELTGHKNLMLRFRHEKLIPGTMDISKPPAPPLPPPLPEPVKN